DLATDSRGGIEVLQDRLALLDLVAGLAEVFHLDAQAALRRDLEEAIEPGGSSRGHDAERPPPLVLQRRAAVGVEQVALIEDGARDVLRRSPVHVRPPLFSRSSAKNWSS